MKNMIKVQKHENYDQGIKNVVKMWQMWLAYKKLD